MQSTRKVTLMAQVDDGEIHRIGHLDIETTKTGPDVSKLLADLEKFGAGFVTAVDASVHDRMVGRALDIDPNPEFGAQLAEAKAKRAPQEDPKYLDGPKHVIIGGRQEGKTRLALKWLNDAPEGVERVLIVASTSQAESMNKDMGFPARSPRIIAYTTLVGKGPRAGVEYGIDETAHILQSILGLKEMPRLVTVGCAEPWQGNR